MDRYWFEKEEKRMEGNAEVLLRLAFIILIHQDRLCLLLRTRRLSPTARTCTPIHYADTTCLPVETTADVKGGFSHSSVDLVE